MLKNFVYIPISYHWSFDHFLSPLKTSEDQRFSDTLRVVEGDRPVA